MIRVLDRKIVLTFTSVPVKTFLLSIVIYRHREGFYTYNLDIEGYINIDLYSENRPLIPL